MTEELKYKVGDLVIIVDADCDNEDCHNCLGMITEVRKRKEYPYRIISADKKIDIDCSIGDDYCIYNEREIRLTTRKEHDKFYLMRYRD